MRVVIMGSGRTGALLAETLAGAGHSVAIIDWDGGAFSRLSDDFDGATVMGNALDGDVLRRAGLDRADAFVAATSGDNRNIMAAQIAREVFNVPRVVVRIKDPVRAEIFRDLGLEVDCRTTAGTRIILDLVAEPQDSLQTAVPR